MRSSKELDGNLGPQGLRPDILQALVARLKWLRKNGVPAGCHRGKRKLAVASPNPPTDASVRVIHLVILESAPA